MKPTTKIKLIAERYLNDSANIHIDLLGASAFLELGLYEEAIAWCDKGLAVSFCEIVIHVTIH